MIRALGESNRCSPFFRPPTVKAIPSTSSPLARMEPTSAAWTTLVSPSCSAKSATKSSGRFPSADWTTPAPPEPSRPPSCSVAAPTSRASAASAPAETKNTSTSFAPAK